MPVQFLKSFLPTADDVLQADLPRLGRILLIHLNSYEGSGTVYQSVGGINREYCIAMMEARNVGLGSLPQSGPEYGTRQPEVTEAVQEAFNWLETQGYLIPTPGQPAIGWLSFTRAGKESLSKAIRFEQWEKLGVGAVKQGLYNDPLRVIGGTAQVREWAAEWVRMKELQNAASDTGYGTIEDTSGSELSLLASKSPAAFITYSWDSPEHRRWVEEFAKTLRCNGVEVILDRWHLKPGDDKFAFMERAINQANFVLMICTPKYADRANQRNGGVGYEATIITPELAGRVSQRKFLHILREGDWEDDSIRKLVKGRIGFDLRGREFDEQYEALIRHLHGAADTPPPIGPRPDFAAKVFGPEAVSSPDHARRGVRFSQLNRDLSPKEVELLWTTAQDPSGQILHSKTLEGEGIRANDRHFLTNADIRSGVEWLGALRNLELRGFIEPLSAERDFFRLTSQGFEAADRLEGFRRWNSEAVVLRAHYFNALPQEQALPCKGIVALPPTYLDSKDSANEAEMPKLKEPRSLLIEGVNSAVQFDWSPNEVEFVDRTAGKSERFRVCQMEVGPRCLKLLLNE